MTSISNLETKCNPEMLQDGSNPDPGIYRSIGWFAESGSIAPDIPAAIFIVETSTLAAADRGSFERIIRVEEQLSYSQDPSWF